MAKKTRKTRPNNPPREEFLEKDPKREDRITMEIVVDCYDSGERAMGWYCYLDNTLKFPFDAICIDERQVSPLSSGEEVEVVGMAESDECHAEMFVLVESDDDDEIAVPLAQLRIVKGDAKTMLAVDDWHYWLAQGYRF